MEFLEEMAGSTNFRQLGDVWGESHSRNQPETSWFHALERLSCHLTKPSSGNIVLHRCHVLSSTQDQKLG